MSKDLESLDRPIIGKSSIHICVDMQRLFAEETEWQTPWMLRVLPQVVTLVEAHPNRTLFTRFIPLENPAQGTGTWRRYYEHWSSMTLGKLGRERVELVPELSAFVPPARVFDKRVYSPWLFGNLHGQLQKQSIDTLIISGGETDVCVLSTVLGGVDRGYRIVLVKDALCSSSDETHDALLRVYESRFGQQIEVRLVEEVLSMWSAGS